jgi:hypothetical protein
MTTPVQKPWAILLCKFNDDSNDPTRTRLSDLYTQWLTQNGQAWIVANKFWPAQFDNRTFLELYTMLFTVAGNGTYNLVRFWDDMSHGSIDTSSTRIFPCTLNMSKADGAALYNSFVADDPQNGPAGYNDEIFKRAKTVLLDTYGVDWQKYTGGVAVSFQSADIGGQGGTYDGGPGVYMDIRAVRTGGTAAWGHEMGHAFGLDHSRLNGIDGKASDYLDPYDVMSTAHWNTSGVDPNYGLAGPGLDAWNMRGRGWLDESRVWKGPANSDFSETIELRPLHRRDLPGYLAAELPRIGADSAYLIEYRVPAQWDAGIGGTGINGVGLGGGVILVHRFEGEIGSFMKSNSYLMQGTIVKGNTHTALAAGDRFVSGVSGPVARMIVQSIDANNQVAVVQLCYSSTATLAPFVKIARSDDGAPDPSCPLRPVEGSQIKFVCHLSNLSCIPGYKVVWSVTGAAAVSGGNPNGTSFVVIAPSPSVLVTVSVTIIFDDGATIGDVYTFNSISQIEGQIELLICHLLQERRLRPIPWWQWDPEKMQGVLRDYSKEEVKVLEQRTERLLQMFRQANRQ